MLKCSSCSSASSSQTFTLNKLTYCGSFLTHRGWKLPSMETREEEASWVGSHTGWMVETEKTVYDL